MVTRKTKPKCGPSSTACGYACITSKKNCSSVLLARDAAKLVKAVDSSETVEKSAKQPNDPTKAMKLDYLNVSLSSEHTEEFNNVMGMTLTDDELDNVVESAVQYSNGGNWAVQNWAKSQDRGKAFQKYMDEGNKYVGAVYRGEAYASDEDALAAINRYKSGENQSIQSWSKSESVAGKFGSTSENRPVSVVYVDNSNKFSDIEKFTSAYHLEFTEDEAYRQSGASEQEVVSNTSYKPAGKVTVVKKGNTYMVTHNART